LEKGKGKKESKSEEKDCCSESRKQAENGMVLPFVCWKNGWKEHRKEHAENPVRKISNSASIHKVLL